MATQIDQTSTEKHQLCLTPIHSLPDDVLLLIFAETQFVSYELPVAEVCRRWRSLALSCPSLWKDILYQPKQSSRAHGDQQLAWDEARVDKAWMRIKLARTGSSTDLRITMDLTYLPPDRGHHGLRPMPDSTAFHYMVDQFARCSSLELWGTLPSNWSVLERKYCGPEQIPLPKLSFLTSLSVAYDTNEGWLSGGLFASTPRLTLLTLHTMPVHPALDLDLSALRSLKLTSSATTLIEITAFLERVSDTLEGLELSGEFRTPLSLDRNLRMSPRHPDDVFKPPKYRVTLPHLRTLALHRLTLDKWVFAALAHYNLIRMPGLETLQLDEIKGGLKAVIAFFGTREGISPLGNLKELHIWGKTTKNSSEDSLANMLRHLKGLEVLFVDRSPNAYEEFKVDYYCRDQLKYDEDDEWLEALRGPRRSEDDSDGDHDAPTQQSDLEEMVCPNLRKLSLRRIEVDSRLLQDVVESRWDGGGGALKEVRFSHLKFSDDDEGCVGLDWVPEDLLVCDCGLA